MRSEVMWFANKMEKKLQLMEVIHQPRWTATSGRFLLNRLLDEAEELVDAIEESYHLHAAGYKPVLDSVISECIDVANFAMMIAGKARRQRF